MHHPLFQVPIEKPHSPVTQLLLVVMNCGHIVYVRVTRKEVVCSRPMKGSILFMASNYSHFVYSEN